MWTEGQFAFASPFVCGEPPPLPGYFFVSLVLEFRDQRGDVVVDVDWTDIRGRSFSVEVADRVPAGSSFGTVDLKTELVFLEGPSPPVRFRLQTWVMSRLRAEGRFSVGLHAARLDDLCE